MTTPSHPDDELDEHRDPETDIGIEDLAYFSDVYALSQECGWFYPDDD